MCKGRARLQGAGRQNRPDSCRGQRPPLPSPPPAAPPAAILPTPLTALLLVLELSRAQVTLGTRYGLAYGKLITFLVVAATGGFVVYYAIAG